MFKRTPVVATAAHDLLPDRLQPPPRPPLGLLHEPRRARVKGVSSAHYKEVGRHLASSASSPGPTRPRPRGRCHQAPRIVIHMPINPRARFVWRTCIRIALVLTVEASSRQCICNRVQTCVCFCPALCFLVLHEHQIGYAENYS